MQATPNSQRIHVGIFGEINSGKSSLINAITGQDLSVVSEIKGTTTDPVSKAMELPFLGPILITDTPGLDDSSALGEARTAKAMKALRKCDIALLVTDASQKKSENFLPENNKPCLFVRNKADLLDEIPKAGENEIYVSAKTGFHVNELKELMIKRFSGKPEKLIVSDILPVNSMVALVVSIDKSAPKGRLILPQQQVLRELLDFGHTAVICRDSEFKEILSKFSEGEIKLVITDSQVFETVASNLDSNATSNIMLTSFSILFARYKGELKINIEGAQAIDFLKYGDKVLICEGCTHHRQCDDIGTVKLPRMIKDYTKTEPEFDFYSGGDFPENIEKYSLILHCGGCMLNENEMIYRFELARSKNVNITNYGIAMAYMNGILERCVKWL
ncbi:MAG: [FeFe] hydrogenase H-cluster maturation GTPase HydF [Eubacterium sp.]|jgi:[FeFe] hydrogenase H-cluster maturation GTPase HydF|nr:[FeFe] hydrogenase H-cluster maturation GTPase HydF [Eubacterium sp.]